MNRYWWLCIGLVAVWLIGIAGCQRQAPPATANQVVHGDDHHADGEEHDAHPDDAVESKVSATLAKLASADRQLAESQKFCAVMTHERLGGMGAPLKLDIKGEPVFVCCKGCRTKALKRPDETLATVAELKTKHAAAHR